MKRGTTVLLLTMLATILANSSVGQSGRLGDRALTNGSLTRLNIELSNRWLQALQLHPRAYVKATVTEEQETYLNVGVHLKGQYGTFQKWEDKPSMTLNFDRFSKNQTFHGFDKLHLNNSVSDPAFATELLCREMFQAAGVPVGRASHARLDINNRDAGLYVLVEGYNKKFLKRYFTSASGSLYDSEFVHDVTYPLKNSAASGPTYRSDLSVLTTACLEPSILSEAERESASNGRAYGAKGARLRKLSSVLDLDRFCSFLALEIMTCHFDGYARGINNYWLYHDPTSDRMVFIPHGMDQMFYDPRGSLFPGLKGIVAKAVLETAEGRKLFRERCTALFTNLFPALSNRVEEIRATIRPEFATMGMNAVAQHDKAVADLQRRIGERIEHLRRHLLAAAPGITILNPGGETAITNWLWSIEQGNATLTAEPHDPPAVSERRSAEGLMLRTRLEPDEKAAVGTWEARVLVPKGIYRFSSRVACDQKIFRGPNCPVSLNIWGGQDQQFESARNDAQHLELAQSFSINSEEPEEILIQCQAQSREMNLEFQFGPLILTRVH